MYRWTSKQQLIIEYKCLHKEETGASFTKNMEKKIEKFKIEEEKMLNESIKIKK